MIEKERANGVKGIVGVVYTGVVPVVYQAERELLNGLIESFFVAFAMIAAMMAMVFRDMRPGCTRCSPTSGPWRWCLA